MSEEIPSRVGRAFRDHGSFERIDEGTYESTTTPFEGIVEVAAGEDGRIAYDVTVEIPMLDEVTEDEVADIVEEGWFETFELRVRDVNGVTKADRELDPTVEQRGCQVIVQVSFEDINERRGVDDAGAFINFVEGTFVQGIIPGYEYTDPVTGIISQARQTGGSEPRSRG